MLWLGIQGRKKLADLERSVDALEESVHKLSQAFGSLDLEMTNQVDKLAGIAKRFTGRKGGRPPGKPEGDVEADSEGAGQLGFSRHVL